MPDRPLSGPSELVGFDAREPHGHVRPGPGRPTFARAENPDYRSKGLRPHLEAAAARLGFRDRSLLARVEALWFLRQAQHSLGYLGTQSDPAAKRGFIDRAAAMRDALAVGVAALDSAILEAADANHLPPTTDTKGADHGPGQRPDPVDPALGRDVRPAPVGRARGDDRPPRRR